jgi:carotenoid cleavage dioxygenase
MKDPDPRVESRRIDEFESEFPQCDPRYAGQSYRHGWFTFPTEEQPSTLGESETFYNTVSHRAFAVPGVRVTEEGDHAA